MLVCIIRDNFFFDLNCFIKNCILIFPLMKKGIDTDKHKYPIGSGRVTFNCNRSYMKAVASAFIEIKTTKFTKKVQVDPYLEDALCSMCGLHHGPYYCREMSCFR